MSKCAECGERFMGSTSTKMADQQYEHWKTTGEAGHAHRSYLGIRGWGNKTYGHYTPKPKEVITVPSRVGQMLARQQPVPQEDDGVQKQEVQQMIDEALGHVRGIPHALSELKQEHEHDMEIVGDLDKRLHRIEGALKGLVHNLAALLTANGHAEKIVQGPPPPKAPPQVILIETPETIAAPPQPAGWTKTAATVGPLHGKPKRVLGPMSAERKRRISETMKRLKAEGRPVKEEAAVRERLMAHGLMGPDMDALSAELGMGKGFAQKLVHGWMREGKVKGTLVRIPGKQGHPPKKYDWVG